MVGGGLCVVVVVAFHSLVLVDGWANRWLGFGLSDGLVLGLSDGYILGLSGGKVLAYHVVGFWL